MEGNYTLFYNKELNVPLRCVPFGFSYRFVASDVCAVLELDPNIVIDNKLFCWERGICPVYMDGDVVDCICIPAETVYHLCDKSTSANADGFRKWFQKEVVRILRVGSEAHNLDVVADRLLDIKYAIKDLGKKLDNVYY